MSESLPDQIRKHLQEHFHQQISNDNRPSGWFRDDEGIFYLETVKRHSGGVIVELGTHLGRSMSYILEHCRATNSKLYAVDLWVDMPQYVKTERYGLFLENLKKMNATDYVKVLRMDSSEAARNFQDNSVDVVFIDTLHTYEVTKSELDAWWPKLKIGGEMLGHDYNSENGGLTRAVDECFGKPDRVDGCMWIIKKTCKERKKSESI